MLLLGKLALVAGMLALGVRNAGVARRTGPLGRPLADTNASLAALRRSLAGELIFAGSVIGLVAFLGTRSPLPM